MGRFVAVAGGALVLAVGLAGCQEAGSPVAGASASAGTASVVPGSVVPDEFVATLRPIDKAMLDTSGLTWKPLPASATLVGPHFSQRYARIAEVSELTAAQRSMVQLEKRSDPEHPIEGLDELGNAPLRPGTGTEFLLVQEGEGPAPALTATGAGNGVGDVSTALVVSGKPRPVRLTSTSADGELLLAVVPTNAPVAVAVTDAGRTQSLDLRTGKRAGDAIAGYYPLLSGERRFDELVHIDGVDRGGTFTPLSTSVELRLQPYVDGKGWAAPGRAWLTVDLSVVLVEADVSMTVDLAKSLTLRGPGVPRLPAGTRVTVQGGSTTLPFGAGAVALDVPASLRRVTASYATTATITKDGGSAPLSWSRRSRSTSGTIQLR